MSSFVGSPADRFSLARAVDALADAARHAGSPGLIWLVGVLYPSLNLNVDLVRGVLALVERASGIELPYSGDVGPIVTLFAPRLPAIEFDQGGPGLLFVFLLCLLPILGIYRLIVGLAKVSDPTGVAGSGSSEAHGGKRRALAPLRRVWSEGRGLALVAFGLWAMLLLLLFGAMLFLIGPVVALVKVLGLARLSPLFAGLLVPVLLLILAYASVLMVLNQLALHSLAHNRRGVASALTHAWRLVRASPMDALRATLVDFALFLSIVAVNLVLSNVLLAPRAFAGLAALIALLLYGFAGVTRAGFWARTYRALGGLSSADRVPGL